LPKFFRANRCQRQKQKAFGNRQSQARKLYRVRKETRRSNAVLIFRMAMQQRNVQQTSKLAGSTPLHCLSDVRLYAGHPPAESPDWASAAAGSDCTISGRTRTNIAVSLRSSFTLLNADPIVGNRTSQWARQSSMFPRGLDFSPENASVWPIFSSRCSS